MARVTQKQGIKKVSTFVAILYIEEATIARIWKTNKSSGRGEGLYQLEQLLNSKGLIFKQ